LFTDIEGSTRLWEEDSERMRAALARHDEIVRAAVSGHDGYVFATGGDGFAAAFGRATDAVAGAIDAQLGLHEAELLAVRMALHTGEADERGGDYFGPVVNRAARLMAIAHGGQVLVSPATQEVVGSTVSLVDLGIHRLRDLAEPVQVFQLCHPALPSAFPPLHSLDAYPTNLPAQSTAFIGRHEEMAEVEKALGEARMVTLTGVGGVGKTRLALQTAAEVLPQYGDGAWVVDLAGVADADGIEEAAAAALGIAPQPGRSVRDSVLTFLSNKRLLVVLDNCEHLLDEVAQLVGEVLRRAPQVSVLATSREALRVDGEHVVGVPSLAVPEEAVGLDLLAGSDAVRLFVERARAARAGFGLTSENAAAVVHLCRRLDGIPLAIELASARVRSMAPTEIAARLDQRFRLLTGGSRTAANRHQTLRRAIDWSYDLLAEDERTVLGRLSVCVGGFDLLAAEAIGAGGAIDARDVDDVLGRLVDKSLVGATDLGDTTRYRMLETVREYALERLEATGDMPAVRTNHARHYAAFATDAGAGLKGAEERHWLLRVEEELDNLRAAVTWSLEGDDADAALAIIRALGLQGLRIEPSVSSWAATAVASPGASLHPEFPVALALFGWWRLNEGRMDEAATLLDDAIAALDQRKVPPPVACRVLCPAAGGHSILGRDPGPRARRWLEEARAARDPYEAALALNICSVGQLMDGDPAAATTAEESLAEARRSGSPTAIAYCSFSLANALGNTEVTRATELIDESLRYAAAAENAFAEAMAIGVRSVLASKQGDHLGAARIMLRAAERAHHVGHLDQQAGHVLGLAGDLAALGELEVAAILRGWGETIVIFSERQHSRSFLGDDAFAALMSLPNRIGPEQYPSLTARGAAMSGREILEFAAARMPPAIVADGNG
jgi:predicted ATPase